MRHYLKKYICAAAAVCTAVSVISPAAVYAEGSDTEYDDEIVTFIVQTEYTPAALVRAAQEASGAKRGMLKGARGADPGAEVEKKNQSILEQAAKELEVDTSDSIIYTEVDSGFTITCRRGDMEKLLAIDGIINVEEDIVFYAVPDNEEPEGDEVLSSAAAEAEYLGEGTLIAVIDGGFDLDHPYFEAAPESPKLSADDATAKIDSMGYGKYVSEKIPYTYDYYSGYALNTYIEDDPEHGTHVAGIAAGKNGTFTANVGEVTINGAAPEAQLALMAASSGPNSGRFNWSVVKLAINDAIKLGADVINMSLGSPYVDIRHGNYKDVLTSITNARKAGITVCVAQGNDSIGFYNSVPCVENMDYGASGMMANYTDAFSVASVNAETYYDNLTKLVTGDGLEIAANTYPDSYTSKTFASTVTAATEFVDCGTGQASDFTGKTLKNKIALIKRGDNTFEDKTKNAKNAGAIAAIIYDNVDEPYLNISGCVLPSVFITKSDGERLAAAATKTVYVNGTMSVKLTDNATANEPSSFTSWGFSETMQLTPNISAYGGNIYSAAPGGGYQNLSGTSMASPYIAGASACVRSYLNALSLGSVNYGELTQQLLMSTAIPLRHKDNDALTYSPRVQGAGMVSVDNAVVMPVVLYNTSGKTLINLGDDIGSSFTLSFKAKNFSDKDVTFDKVNVTVTTDGTAQTTEGDIVVYGTNPLTVSSYTSDPVTVPANGEKDISINVELNGSQLQSYASVFTNGFYIDGFVKLSNDDYYAGLPFSGFRGNWGSVPIWDSTIYDDGGSELIYKNDNINLNGTYLTTKEKNKTVTFGGSGTKYTIISPANGDGYYDTLSAIFAPRRSLSAVTLSLVQNNTAKVSRSVNDIHHKYNQYTYELANTKVLTSTLKALADGDYTFCMAGKFNDGSSTQTQNLNFPITVTIDNTAPEISMVLSDDYKTLAVTAADTNYIRSITVNYTDNDGNAKTETKTFGNTNKSESNVFTLVNANPFTISVTAVDYAYNTAISDDYAVTAQSDSAQSTAFKKTISNTGTASVTYSRVSGTVTSDGITKSFEHEFTTDKTLESGAGLIIGIIVEGLYDNTAAAVFQLK